MKLLSNDFQNLFNLCGDSTEYVTDPTSNMEDKSLNLVSSDQEEVSSYPSTKRFLMPGTRISYSKYMFILFVLILISPCRLRSYRP